MKRFTFRQTAVYGLFALVLLALTSCTLNLDLNVVTGSGNVVEREFQFTDFDQVEINNAFRGTITQGDTYSIVVRVDDNLEQYLRVEQNGDKLIIGLTPGTAVNRATMEYGIVMPALSALDASGASVAEMSGFASGESFTGNASGASRIEGTLSSGDARFDASGASTIRLSGQGGNVNATASGASTVDLEDFAAADADAVASGASNITVNASGTLNAEASGASTVRYVGNPTLGNINESGGSNVSSK